MWIFCLLLTEISKATPRTEEFNKTILKSEEDKQIRILSDLDQTTETEILNETETRKIMHNPPETRHQIAELNKQETRLLTLLIMIEVIGGPRMVDHQLYHQHNEISVLQTEKLISEMAEHSSNIEYVPI